MGHRGHIFVWNTTAAVGVCKACLLTFPRFAIDDEAIPECAGEYSSQADAQEAVQEIP